MTAAQLHDARVLIPGAYEAIAPPHRDTAAAHMVATASSPELCLHAATAAMPYVIDAPTRPKTRLGRGAAILGDVALVTAILFVIALAPALVVQGIHAVAALVLDTLGRR